MDSSIRLAAFRFLAEESQLHGDVLPRDILARGFQFENTRVPLIGPQGIFKPAVLDLPLSITTVAVVEGRARPYEDEIGEDGGPAVSLPRHRPNHRDKRRRGPACHPGRGRWPDAAACAALESTEAGSWCRPRLACGRSGSSWRNTTLCSAEPAEDTLGRTTRRLSFRG
jgi:hypothetical protein